MISAHKNLGNSLSNKAELSTSA